MSTAWTIDDARRTYAVPHWGAGYVDVDAGGHIVIRPRGAAGPALSLPAIVDRACAQGLRLPLLVRFPDILADRLTHLQQAFAQAIAATGYTADYTAIYPIKVNQQRSVAGELVAAGKHGFGLEAGSKPELMAVAALSSLAMPGVVATEWLIVLFGVLLFVAPWALGYTELTGASWTSWVVGAIAVVLGGFTALSTGNRPHRQAIQP